METTFSNQHLTRQLDIVPIRVLSEPITIIGAGAIGGWTTLALAKMGFENLTVFDDDVVSVENMNSQFYRHQDIGKLKVVALEELVADFTGTHISYFQERYLAGELPGIVISAVDNMQVRKTVWEEHQKNPWRTRAIIDPRMGAESALLYVMDPKRPEDVQTYPKTLYGDDDAVQERCTAKATIYTANLLSGLVVKAVKDLLTQQDPLRTVQWDIAGNSLLTWHRSGRPGHPMA